jgi:hypothetical protein
MPRLPQMERASWLAFLQLLGNVPALMTSKRLLKRMGELHHIEDETMLDELVNIGKQMMQAQAKPQQTGSMPNVSEQNPAAAMGGQGSWYSARLALFWSLASITPAMLLMGLALAFLGQGQQTTALGVVVGAVFVIRWVLMLRETERGA